MKKLLFTLIFVTAVFSTVSAVCAEESVALPSFDVTFGEEKVDSEQRQYPLIVYKDITYVPMTYFDCRYLGLSTVWDDETRTLSIEQTPINCAYRDYKWEWKNTKNNKASVCDFNIVVNGKTIDNSKEEYPLLTFRDVTYFPLTWRFAVDEFGWEYSFDSENGLIIKAKNYRTENVTLPNITGSVATDGEYYYYSGEKGGKKVVYRTLVSDTSNPEVIYEMPDTNMTNGASFSNSCGDIYFSYTAGSVPTTSTSKFFKIEKDGSVTEKIPDDGYGYGKHGYYEMRVASEGIQFKGVQIGADLATEISYEKDGKVYEMEPLPGWIRIGERRNGTLISLVKPSSVKIFNNKIYYTAMDYGTKEDSALYVIDTETGEHKKIIDGVCGFDVCQKPTGDYKGSVIIYDDNGTVMLYDETTGESRALEEKGDEDLYLVAAVGGYHTRVVMKNASGNRTVVKTLWADKTMPTEDTVILETKTGTYVSKFDNLICVRTSGESPDDEVRFFVAGNDGEHEYASFSSSDVADSVFVYKNILLYKIGKDKVAKIELK